MEAKLCCGCSTGRSGGARFGTAGAACIDVFETSIAVGGRSGKGSISIRASVGSVSVDLNFCDSVLLAAANLLRDLAGPGVDGRAWRSVSSSSTGDVVKGLVITFPLDGKRGLWPNDADPELGCVRCDRKEADLLTLCPISDTLEVRLRMLLFRRWCPLCWNLLFSIPTPTPSVTVSNGWLEAPSSAVTFEIPPALVPAPAPAGSVTSCFFPVNLPNTLLEEERDGMPSPDPFPFSFPGRSETSCRELPGEACTLKPTGWRL